jgi:hypothetical protein
MTSQQVISRDTPKPGEKWRHFKGGEYVVYGIAHTASDEAFVVYSKNDDWISFVAQHTEEDTKFLIEPTPDGAYNATPFPKDSKGSKAESVAWARPLDNFMDIIAGLDTGLDYYRFERI